MGCTVFLLAADDSLHGQLYASEVCVCTLSLNVSPAVPPLRRYMEALRE